MKARLSRRATMAGVALAAGLALSGCASADTAAVVNGTHISEKGAQEAAAQINATFKPQQPLTPRDAVSALITAPFILRAVAASGHPQSESAARAAMPTLNDPADTTIEMVRAQAAFQFLTDADKKAILEELAKAKITVNPRYGSFVPEEGGLAVGAPNWIVKTSNPTPAPAG